MLNRQKSLLYMVRQAGRPVTDAEFVQWSFLLAHEMPSRGGTSFYRFVPHRLGPVSFCLKHEIRTLARKGHLAQAERKGRQVRRITGSVDPSAGDLPKAVRDDIERLADHFRDVSARRLAAYVRRRFPSFQREDGTNCRRKSAAAPAVFTVGYEGLPVDGLLELLIRAGIEALLDVRHAPLSRRYGFHKRTLAALCGQVQIEYRHFPELGIPSQLRRNLASPGDYERLLSWYERRVPAREEAAVRATAALMADRPSALMCMEADPARCHRSRLADAVARTAGLPVRHLGVKDEAGV